nr:hypothetical protein [uncultured Halomonas sp.]
MKVHHIKLNAETKQALEQLISVAQSDTGQAKICADFLLAWHNAEDNGGFALTDLWGLDEELAQSCALLTHWLCDHAIYPDELGYGEEFRAIWQRWRQST